MLVSGVRSSCDTDATKSLLERSRASSRCTTASCWLRRTRFCSARPRLQATDSTTSTSWCPKPRRLRFGSPLPPRWSRTGDAIGHTSSETTSSAADRSRHVVAPAGSGWVRASSTTSEQSAPQQVEELVGQRQECCDGYGPRGCRVWGPVARTPLGARRDARAARRSGRSRARCRRGDRGAERVAQVRVGTDQSRDPTRGLPRGRLCRVLDGPPVERMPPPRPDAEHGTDASAVR